MEPAYERLSSLGVDECATVVALGNRGSMRRRLLDLGFVVGAPIVCVGHSPSGDPKAFLVSGAVIALREADSRLIRVVRSQ